MYTLLTKSTCLMFAVATLASGVTAAEENSVHFHSVRLNVTNPEATIAFYTKNFGAVAVDYAGVTQALFTERSFVLLNKVNEPPRWQPHTAISHIGWAATDGFSEFEWLKRNGVEFETPIGQLGDNFGMYVYGPDKELVELWTGSKNHRFEHIHLWASDVEATVAWYREHLGVMGRAGAKPKTQDYESIGSIQMGTMLLDNVNIIVFGRPDFDSRWWPGGSYTKADAPEGDFAPTKGSTVNHIAFSFRDIAPVYERMKAAGATMVEPIAKREDVGHTSFFTLAPDNVLVEIVQAKPIPDSSWE